LIGRRVLLASAATMALNAAGAADALVELNCTQIRAAISGKTVTDEHHWSHRYYADGRLERSEGRHQKMVSWSVQDNRLCLLKPEIDPRVPVCYRVFRQGNELEYRDDRYVVYRGTVRSM
jgi:hypothetical protein